MKKDITFILNRSEITAGTRGASLGPDAIISAARAKNSTFFSNFQLFDLPHHNNLLDLPTDHRYAKRIEGLITVFEDVSKAVAEELNADRFPFVLAGDHGSAGGTIAGIKQAFPNKRLGVIWIDAHGDLHTPYTTPSGNLHGMPLSTALNDDNLKYQINNVPQETVSQWEKLKAVGFQGTKVLPEDLVFIAVRDLEKEEQSIIDRLNIEVLTVEYVRMNGTYATVQHVLSKLAACDLIYVSFDVDSMDPVATSYGTGTPVPNGLLPHQAGELLNGFATSPKIACVEFVEVNPCLDEKKNHMAEVAFALVESMAHTLTH